MKKIILLTIFLLILPLKNSLGEYYYTEEKIFKYINELNIENAAKDVCIINNYVCNQVFKIAKYLNKNNKYKYGLFYIVATESQFKYIRGIYDKDDISLFQLNWRNKAVRKFANMYNIYTKYKLMHNQRIASKIALRIWLLNISIFYKKKGWFPKYLTNLAALYHNPNKVKKYYVKKLSLNIYKYKRKLK